MTKLNSTQVFDLFDSFMHVLVFQVMTSCPVGGGYQHFIRTHCIIYRRLFRRRGLSYSPETIVIPNDYRAWCCYRYGLSVNPPFCLRQSSFRTSAFISFIPFVPASSSLFSPPPRLLIPVLKELCRYRFEPLILTQDLKVRKPYVCPRKGRRFALYVTH